MIAAAERAAIWEAIGRQLAYPRGRAGRWIGRLMTLANRGPVDAAIRAAGIGHLHDVLDLGCGTGAGLKQIARLTDGAVAGLDRSETMIAAATRRNRRAVARGAIQLAHGSFDALPFADARFDCVLAINVAYFWHDFAAVGAEVRRVLRPGGRLILYVTDAATMRRWPFASSETHRHFDAAGLIAALCDGGFAQSRIHMRAARFPGGVTGLVCRVETAPPMISNFQRGDI